MHDAVKLTRALWMAKRSQYPGDFNLQPDAKACPPTD
jgi:hypothetical protein